MDYDTAVRSAERTIALFHFHDHFDSCRCRLRLLRRLNPGLEIYGLYGGDASRLAEAHALHEHGLANVFFDPKHDPAWKKRNTDLAVGIWFAEIGARLSFDRVHVIQWDLLFVEALARVYPRIPTHAIALTGLTRLSEIESFWPWTSWEAFVPETRRLLRLAHERLALQGPLYACIGPGYSLSRWYLERSVDVDLDAAGHDELRLPLTAQACGIEMVDTGFYPRWRDPEVERAFNADSFEVAPALVISELSKPHGRRAFHPCREAFDERLLEQFASLSESAS